MLCYSTRITATIQVNDILSTAEAEVRQFNQDNYGEKLAHLVNKENVDLLKVFPVATVEEYAQYSSGENEDVNNIIENLQGVGEDLMKTDPTVVGYIGISYDKAQAQEIKECEWTYDWLSYTDKEGGEWKWTHSESIRGPVLRNLAVATRMIYNYKGVTNSKLAGDGILRKRN